MATTDATAPAGSATGEPLVSVLLPLPLAGTYDYAADAGLALRPGDFVRVPLGKRELAGVVWGPGEGGVAPEKIKDVLARLDDAQPLSQSLCRFVDWVATYTMSPPGAVLRMVMNARGALDPPKPIPALRYNGVTPGDDLRMTPARHRVLDTARDGAARTAADLAREAGVSQGVVKGLADAGVLTRIELAPEPIWEEPDPDTHGPALSGDQQEAAAALIEKVHKGAFAVTLLDGVTGAGKTEVYFEAVAEALRQGKQALVLLPEISLTPQWFRRFEARFGTAPVVWHSDIGMARRRAAWRAVADGTARVVVGARSALFLPFHDLGLIVVDEEHEAAYKQEDGVAYHARDMAVVRAQLSACPAVLVSATPSLETRVNVARSRYDELTLPQRFGAARQPEIETVDMREAGLRADCFLSPRLRELLLATCEAGEQSLLFLNRRGYAPLTLCRSCGHRFECPSCSAWLVEHRYQKRLQCHHCGHNEPVPPACPHCGAEESLAACGPGVERIAEEVHALDPKLRIALMTSDTILGPDAAQTLVQAIEDRTVDVLIGTQMVAKGHHFPGLTLVGIVDADLGLDGGDLRAAERSYQVLHQVAGRAGRAERPGRVIVQTYQPDHPVMRALVSGDRDAFMEVEQDNRRAGGWPPFGRLAAVIVSSRDANAADQVAGLLARRAPAGPDLRVLGPAPAPLALLRGQHRRRLLVKAARNVPLQALMHDWLTRVTVPARVDVRIDIDPYSFM